MWASSKCRTRDLMSRVGKWSTRVGRAEMQSFTLVLCCKPLIIALAESRLDDGAVRREVSCRTSAGSVCRERQQRVPHVFDCRQCQRQQVSAMLVSWRPTRWEEAHSTLLLHRFQHAARHFIEVHHRRRRQVELFASRVFGVRQINPAFLAH